MDYVLSSDIDWASEYCIEKLLAITARYEVTPTLFVTHESSVIQKALNEGRVELGIHAKFLPNSSHGNDVDGVIDHLLSIVPHAIAVRCHAYTDGTHIAKALVRRGFGIDSNICCHLQRDLRPLYHWCRLLRLPVFFEDDVHWDRGGQWSFDRYASDFFSSGLKILNFHPFFVALNVPDADFYARHKSYIKTLTRGQARLLRYDGPGVETFLVEAIEQILDAGHRFVTIGELACKMGNRNEN